jgi:hypothetical protein
MGRDMGLADEWKKIKSKPSNKELANGSKYKPDLGTLVSKYDSDLKQRKLLDDQTKTCLADMADAVAKTATAKTALNAVFDARDKAVDDINKATADFNSAITSAGNDPVAKAKAFSDYAPLYTQYSKTRKDADTKIDKGIDDIEKIIRDAATKSKKTSDDIQSKGKKLDAELDKLYDDIPSVITGYIRVAQQSKNLGLETDLKNLLRQVPVKA